MSAWCLYFIAGAVVSSFVTVTVEEFIDRWPAWMVSYKLRHMR